MSIRSIARQIHNTAVEKGWWTHNRNVPEALAQIHSEVSEALEEFRMLQDGENVDTVHYDETMGNKPVGFAVELADIIIHTLDLAEGMGIDLELIIIEKMNYNKDKRK